MTDALGAAATRWNDYVGTAAADDAAAQPQVPSLYSLAGLDRDEWAIAAIEVALKASVPAVSVYAARRADLTEAAEEGDLAVTEFRLNEQQAVEAFLNEAFAHISLRLVAKPFLGRALTTTAAEAAPDA